MDLLKRNQKVQILALEKEIDSVLTVPDCRQSQRMCLAQ